MANARIAVCSWSLHSRDPDDLLAKLAAVEMDAVQLALSPVVAKPQVWEERLRAAGVTIVSGMMAMAGEDYSTLQSIARTGGVRPDATWRTNLAHAAEISRLAASWEIPLVTFHAGFIPHDRADPQRSVMVERLRRIADVFAEVGVDLAFETGQETAETLLAALHELDRPNVGVNFDPANMILYGMGEPVAALRRLSPHVRQIHIKDARASGVAGQWGTEVPVGQGDVNWPSFIEVVQTLRPPVALVIEREAGADRTDDIIKARVMLERLLR